MNLHKHKIKYTIYYFFFQPAYYINEKYKLQLYSSLSKSISYFSLFYIQNINERISLEIG